MAAEHKDLEDWIRSFPSTYCRKCSDNCCNGTRQLINIANCSKDIDFFIQGGMVFPISLYPQISGVFSINLFLEKGLQLYKMSEVEENSLINWLVEGMLRGLGGPLFSNNNNFIGDVLSREEKPIKKPAILETPVITECSIDNISFGEDKMYVLYLDKFCPFYKIETGCEVYSNPNRPDCCKSYPVRIKKSQDNTQVFFQELCPSSKEAIKILKENYNNIEIISR